MVGLAKPGRDAKSASRNGVEASPAAGRVGLRSHRLGVRIPPGVLTLTPTAVCASPPAGEWPDRLDSTVITAKSTGETPWAAAPTSPSPRTRAGRTPRAGPASA